MKTSLILFSLAALTAGAAQAQTVDEQIARNEQHDRAAYERLVEAGGCNADSVQVEYAAYCWRNANGSGSPNPTGGPVGASQGGE